MKKIVVLISFIFLILSIDKKKVVQINDSFYDSIVSVERNYDTVDMPSYFYYNNSAFGNNVTYSNNYGSCTVVAALLLMSYYDAFYNDDIIQEQYEVKGSIGKKASSQISPGIMFDSYDEFEKILPKYNFVIQEINNFTINLEKVSNELEKNRQNQNLNEIYNSCLAARNYLMNAFNLMIEMNNIRSNSIEFDGTFYKETKEIDSLEYIEENFENVYSKYVEIYDYFCGFDWEDIRCTALIHAYDDTMNKSLHSYYAKKLIMGKFSSFDSSKEIISDVIKSNLNISENEYLLNNSTSNCIRLIDNELSNSRPVIANIYTNTAGILHAVVIYDEYDNNNYIAHYGYKNKSCGLVSKDSIYSILRFVPYFSKKKSNNYIINDGINTSYGGCEYNHVYKCLSSQKNYDIIECIACHKKDTHTHIVNRKTFICNICGECINNTKVGVIESIPQYDYFE